MLMQSLNTYHRLLAVSFHRNHRLHSNGYQTPFDDGFQNFSSPRASRFCQDLSCTFFFRLY